MHSYLNASSLFKDVPLDQQVDSKIPGKRDPLYKIEKKKKISYEGLWNVKPVSTSCAKDIDGFKIKINGQKIDTIVGMTVNGSLKTNGDFQMKAQSQFWSIDFKGTLKEGSGKAEWVRKILPSGECAGVVTLERSKT